MQYYNSNIQIDKKVIDDVFANIKPDTKMLVFGLGYDSKMWYYGCNKNVYFVEDNDEYIRLNSEIPQENIVKYVYKTSVSSTPTTDASLFEIPKKLLDLAPFDIIIVDGPTGWAGHCPGRLLPCYWSTLLSKPGTLVYIDDSSRDIEKFCIAKFFSSVPSCVFLERSQCTKVTIPKLSGTA